MALSAASRRKINGRKTDGEEGGMGYRGQTEEERRERERGGTESEKKVREDRKRGRAGGDECAAIPS